MAKTIIEDLMAGLSPDLRAQVQATIAANPQLVVKDRQMGELFGIYMNEEPAPSATAPVVEAHIPGVPVGASAAASPTALPTADNPVMAELAKLNSTLDTRLKTIESSMVKKDELPGYRTELLSLAIKTADDYAGVRETHHAEFGETLNRGEFEKFVGNQATAGIRYVSDPADTPNGKTGLQKAHDQFVADRRTQNQIQKGISEGLKTKQSGALVPGQTQSTAMSPAQAVLVKAREGVNGGGKSNALAAAERMAAMVRSREEAGAGTVN